MEKKTYAITGAVIIAVIIIAIAIAGFSAAGPQTAADEKTRIIYDSTGAGVAIPDEIHSIVNCDPMSAQIIIMLNGSDRLTGALFGPSNRSVLVRIFPAADTLPSPASQTTVNLEELLSLSPDVVISSESYAEVNKMIEEVNIPVVKIDFETPEGFMQSVDIIGEILDGSEKAQEYNSYYTDVIDGIEADLEDIPDDSRVRVYFAGKDIVLTAGSGWYQNYLVENAGGINVAVPEIEGGWKTITPEQILVWNPDVIVLAPYCQVTVSDIMSNPQYADLDAVKNGRVYRMPKFIMAWDLPVPENVLGTIWLSQILSPDLETFDIKDEIPAFYSTYYGYEITDEDMKDILTDDSILKVGEDY